MGLMQDMTRGLLVLLFVVSAPVIVTIVANLSIRNVATATAVSIVGSLAVLAAVVLAFLGTSISPDDRLVLLIFVILWGLASSAITATLMRLMRRRAPGGVANSK